MHLALERGSPVTADLCSPLAPTMLCKCRCWSSRTSNSDSKQQQQYPPSYIQTGSIPLDMTAAGGMGT